MAPGATWFRATIFDLSIVNPAGASLALTGADGSSSYRQIHSDFVTQNSMASSESPEPERPSVKWDLVEDRGADAAGNPLNATGWFGHSIGGNKWIYGDFVVICGGGTQHIVAICFWCSSFSCSYSEWNRPQRLR